MRGQRPGLVVIGQVVLAARPDGLETAEAVGIADGTVVIAGSAEDVRHAAHPGARVIDAGPFAVVPGLHDFHLHLVGMARARLIADLESAQTMDDVVERVAAAAGALPPGAWVRGDGWHAEALSVADLERLESVLAGHPALLKSHDRHSAWASAGALALSGVDERTPDPPAGRIERDARGRPNGLLRESVADLVADRAPRMVGAPLNAALREVIAELASVGITSVTDAGDPTIQNGIGDFAALGDSFSNLAMAGEVLAAGMRVTLDLPAAAIDVAAARGLRSGISILDGDRVNVGWAKLYADGTLGSRTAALFEPYSCGHGDHRGILRMGPEELDHLVSGGRRAGIGLAIHAIGDRAVAEALAALERGPARGRGLPPDRIEHAQLVRATDRARFAKLGVTASVQPIHLPSDRLTAERCWAGRLQDAYAYASLASAGALLAFGSDAPIESPNPWRGIHAAVRRRAPGEAGEAWQPDQALSPTAALSAYTLGPARAAGRTDLGHLRPGARADLAVLDVDIDTLLAADERLAAVSSRLTLVDGGEVHAG